MEPTFINRETELEWLENLYKKKGSNFTIIYGRRRVGKTALVKKFIKNKRNLYYMASKGNETEQLLYLSEKCCTLFGDDYLMDNPFRNWHGFFRYLNSKAGEEKLVLVFDEFPFLINSNKAIPSIFQKYWDEELSKKNILLVILGSSMSLMYSSVIAYSSPLYGRRTGQIKLNMFKFMDYKKFFPCNKTEDIVKYFSITDGLPFYINFIDKTKTAEENIIQNISSPQSILYEEGEILVKEELGDVPTYFSILDAIASGKNKLGEIANFTGMNSHSLTGYIKKLLLIGLIKKEAPIIEKITSKKGIYLLSDNFLDFWFKFIYPSKSSINEKEELRKKLHKNYNSYLGFVFEQIAKEFLILKQPFEFVKIGRQWSRIPKVKQSYEIDLVALNEDNREIGFFECKWSNLKTGESFGILNKLKQKSKFVDWNLDNRKEHFGLIAKKIDDKEELKKQGFFVWDLDDF